MEEERPRRARGTAEILRCYPVPIHFQNATLLNSQYYFTAQFPATGIHSPQPFTVGDNKTYNGYWNAPLLPQKSYSIYYQAVSSANGVGVSDLLLFSSYVGCDSYFPETIGPLFYLIQYISVYITSEDFAFYVTSATLAEELRLFLLRGGRNTKFAFFIEGRNTGNKNSYGRTSTDSLKSALLKMATSRFCCRIRRCT